MNEPMVEKELKNKLKVQFFAKDNCKKCYGRGVIGFNIISNEPQPCTCLRMKKYKPEELVNTETVENTS